MPDVYSIITTVDSAVVARIADAMEISAADPQHRAMVAAYLDDLGPADGARLLEIGCGTGAIARVLAAWPGVGQVLGVDPSPILLTRARELSEGIANLSFEAGDGRRLPAPDAAVDAVVMHRVLSHVPNRRRSWWRHHRSGPRCRAEGASAPARRLAHVLRPRGVREPDGARAGVTPAGRSGLPAERKEPPWIVFPPRPSSCAPRRRMTSPT